MCATNDGCVADAAYALCVTEVRRDLITSTAAVSALASGLMGFFANLPVGMAPGLGLNAYVRGLKGFDDARWGVLTLTWGTAVHILYRRVPRDGTDLVPRGPRGCLHGRVRLVPHPAVPRTPPRSGRRLVSRAVAQIGMALASDAASGSSRVTSSTCSCVERTC